MIYDYGFSSNFAENDPRQTLWSEQRNSRGFDDTEVIALDISITKFSLPRLKVYREKIARLGYFPGCLQSNREWLKIIDEIIFCFQESLDSGHNRYDYKRVDDGYKLFFKYFHSLWI